MYEDEVLKVKQRFGIIGNSLELNNAVNVAVQVANTDLSVLVTGESGVGKEFFPQILHQYSPRKHGPYIAVNCGGIPEGTIDSELFGHEKGAFTGATSERKGYFEVADGGTIFLDEVGELPLSTQVRLLRVLESGEFIRVGSSKVMKTNVRVVAATNRDMSDAVRRGVFRADLYYRLNSIPVNVPPLRDRSEDILRLFRKFTSDVSEKYRMPSVKLTEDARQALISYRWPGNIRELKNVAERLSVLEKQREIDGNTLRMYLPENSLDKIPALYHGNQSDASETHSFSSEREILYTVLFDMKKDMRDLKALVNDLMQKNGMDAASFVHPVYSHIYDPQSSDVMPAPSGEVYSTTPIHKKDVYPASPIHKKDHPDIQDASEYVEESLSLEELEKEAIRKALERNGGKRKNAAADLNISERTLYRKIKEYRLES